MSYEDFSLGTEGLRYGFLAAENNGKLPAKRGSDLEGKINKRPKVFPVSYEEWEPYSKIFRSLDFNKGAEGLSESDISEMRSIAAKMSTPEGLFDVLNDLEDKLSAYQDIPLDPTFENLSLNEKIDQLFQELNK